MDKVLESYLKHGVYTIEDATARISYLVANGEITPERAEELRLIAEENAMTDIPLEKQVKALETVVGQHEEALVEIADMTGGV